MIEGYLLKEGRDRVLNKFQKRYCVLYYNPAVLRIYSSMTKTIAGNMYIDEKQSIPYECYSGIEYKSGSTEFTLLLKVTQSSIKNYEVGNVKRKMVFKAEGPDAVKTAQDWVECFRDFKNKQPHLTNVAAEELVLDSEDDIYIPKIARESEEEREKNIGAIIDKRKTSKMSTFKQSTIRKGGLVKRSLNLPPTKSINADERYVKCRVGIYQKPNALKKETVYSDNGLD